MGGSSTRSPETAVEHRERPAPAEPGRKPWRFALAQLVCRRLPPIVAFRARKRLYPHARALEDDYPFAVRAQTGSVLRGGTADKHAVAFGVHGYNEWRLWAIALATCSRGDTIVEIGANVGTETVGFSDIVGGDGRVVAIEPFPPNVESLEEALADVRYRNVDVLPFAVADTPGTVEFVVPPSRFSSGEGYVRGPGEAARDVVEVECVTLDSLADTIGAARLVAIDTEGAEALILRGGRQFLGRHRPVLVLEASPKNLGRSGTTIDELHGDLLGLGYAIKRVTRLGLDEVEDKSFAGYQNWLCVQDPAAFERIARSIRRCGVLPCVGRLNPLSRPRGR